MLPIANQYLLFIQTFFLYINAITEVPAGNLCSPVLHQSVHTPDNNAGASERAGFIDAPDIKAKNKISNPTIPPITIGPNPFKPFV